MPAHLAGDQADPTTVERIRIEMGLDKPLPAQFLDYVAGIFRGDLGFAWHTGHSVVEDLATRMPATIELGVTAELPAGTELPPRRAAANNRRWRH